MWIWLVHVKWKSFFLLVFPDAPTVSDLSLSQISKLADLLNTDNGWEDFANVAFENDDGILKQVSNLHRHYYGGSNLAHSFLIRLTQKYFKHVEFWNIFIKF